MDTTTETGTSLATPTDAWTALDRLFADLAGPFFGPFVGFPSPPAPPRGPRLARVDVTDTGTSYKVAANLPGIPKDKLAVRVRGTSVEIHGEVGQTTEKTEGDVLHRERSFTGYYRSLELPEPVIGAEAKATLENGVLELELPKQHPTPSPVEVQVPVQ
jgi:HSP20 family protein